MDMNYNPVNWTVLKEKSLDSSLSWALRNGHKNWVDYTNDL